MKKLFSTKIVLILIVVAAFAIRFYSISLNPPSLNWDETSIAYNAYSILKTGRDEWGEVLPLHFRAYGEYKLPVQVYASIPGIWLFGLTELGVRITPVVYGTLTVLLLFYLAREITRNTKIALIASFLLALSPWHIHLTRASFESSFSIFWVMLGILLLLKGLKNGKWLVLSVLPLVLAVYTYNSARVFVPLFLIGFFIIYRKKLYVKKKAVIAASLMFVAFLLPLIPFSLSGDVANRYKLVSIIDDPGLVPRIDEARNLSSLPQPAIRLVHNRVTYTTATFISNYFAHFKPDYLFISGAPHRQHHVQDVGQLYLIQAPFIFLGLYYLFKGKKKYRWLLVIWILFAFLPVSITRDSIPHALRTIIAAPAYQILTAFGLVESIRLATTKNLRRLLVVAPVAILLISFGKYQYNYYTKYPFLYSRDWQYGYKEVVGYIKEHYSEYDRIVFTRSYGEPHMFTLFYLGWDPASFQNNPNLVRFETYDWVRVLAFDKFNFPDLGDEGTRYEDIVSKNPDEKILFIGKPGDFPVGSEVVYEVDFLNGNPAFEIVKK